MIVQCSAQDTDGRDADGNACVQCSAQDTDGKDASGKPCVEIVQCSAADTDGKDANGKSCTPDAECSASDPDGKDAAGNLCVPIVECSAQDTDGKDAMGKPCVPVVECSAADSDALDATGKPCTTTVPETPDAEVCTEAGSVNADDDTVCGGGIVEQPLDSNLPVSSPTEGGGTPVAASGISSSPTAAQTVSGGGAQLPFTGLPLWYAMFAGLGLMIIGGGFWARGRIAGNKE